MDKHKVRELVGPLLVLSGLLASLLVLLSGPNSDQTYWQRDFLYVGWVPGVFGIGIGVLLNPGGRAGLMLSAAVAGALSGAGAAIAGFQLAQAPACDSAWYMAITRMAPAAAGMSGVTALIGGCLLSRVLSSTGIADVRYVPRRLRVSSRRALTGLVFFDTPPGRDRAGALRAKDASGGNRGDEVQLSDRLARKWMAD